MDKLSLPFVIKFGLRPCTIVQGVWHNFLATLKIQKNSILIVISSNFLHDISTCMCIRKCIKMKNSLLAIFAKNSKKIQF